MVRFIKKFIGLGIKVFFVIRQIRFIQTIIKSPILMKTFYLIGLFSVIKISKGLVKILSSFTKLFIIFGCVYLISPRIQKFVEQKLNTTDEIKKLIFVKYQMLYNRYVGK